jgi:cyclophilin type peptidyl-prolyl cis-trans isomerase/CLD
MRLSNVKRFCLPLTGSILLAVLLLAVPMSSAANETFVRLGTDSGEILIYMDSTIAPNHVNNFLKLGRDGFYTGTVFHRVIPGFMIQGGDPNSKDENRGDDGMGGPKWADVLSAEDMAKLEEVRSVLTAKGYLAFGDQACARHPVHGPLAGRQLGRQPVLHLCGQGRQPGQQVHGLRPGGHGHGRGRRHRLGTAQQYRLSGSAHACHILHGSRRGRSPDRGRKCGMADHAG